VSVFRRRKGGQGTADQPDSDGLQDGPQVGQDEHESGAGSRHGPWDVADAPQDDVVRLDLGSILVPGLAGVEVQVNLDEASGVVVAVTAVHEGSALQLAAFAAPRNEPIWPDVRRELAAQITSDGGLADVQAEGSGVDEPAGTLRAKVPVPAPDGSVAMGEVRFIGTDGPRWMLRGVLSGPGASDPAAAQTLLALYRGVIVVRGNEAFAPSEPLPLRLPDQSGQPGAAPEPDQPPGPAGRDPLDLDGTGQRITHTR
jgi:Protein of unknown function (DUF3710)